MCGVSRVCSFHFHFFYLLRKRRWEKKYGKRPQTRAKNLSMKKKCVTGEKCVGFWFAANFAFLHFGDGGNDVVDDDYDDGDDNFRTEIVKVLNTPNRIRSSLPYKFFAFFVCVTRSQIRCMGARLSWRNSRTSMAKNQWKFV